MAVRVKNEKLYEIMKSKPMTREELAHAIGITDNYLYRIMAENLPVGPKVINGLLKITKYNYHELFFDEVLTI